VSFSCSLSMILPTLEVVTRLRAHSHRQVNLPIVTSVVFNINTDDYFCKIALKYFRTHGAFPVFRYSMNETRCGSQHRSQGEKEVRRMHCRTRQHLECSTTYRIKISVGVIMGFGFMARMVMVVRPVVARVLMVVCLGGTTVRVFMEMFVQVLMGMSMGVLMAVHLAVMGMFVGVRMSVVMSVQMLVFVLSFHDKSSLS